MTRRQWMWLWIWLLLFFIIFCIWNKLQTISSDKQIPISEVSSTTLPILKDKVNMVEIKEVEQIAIVDVIQARDINLKIIKNDASIKISGLFSSQEDVDNLKAEYAKISDSVEEGTIIIDKNAKNSDLIKLIPTLSSNFAKFKNGYFEYTDKKLTIDGVVSDESIKNDIDEKTKQIVNFSIDNRITVEKPVFDEPSISDIQTQLDKLLKVKKVEFIYGKAILTTNSKKIINEAQAILAKYNNIAIEIGGHTDSDGSPINNRALSQKRADAIKKYLVSRGIDAKRLKAVGYGENKPLVKNDSSSNKQINRRVEFKVLGE